MKADPPKTRRSLYVGVSMLASFIYDHRAYFFIVISIFIYLILKHQVQAK